MPRRRIDAHTYVFTPLTRKIIGNLAVVMHEHQVEVKIGSATILLDEIPAMALRNALSTWRNEKRTRDNRAGRND